MSYLDIYKKRLNRFGDDYFSRIQGEREKNFELYLMRSTCRIDFLYQDEVHPGSFERYQQTASKTLHYLLTRVGLNLVPGTILDIKSVDGIEDKWMVFWKDNIQATGYDRYVMLRMSHYITWRSHEDGQQYDSWCYLWGPQDAIIREEVLKAGRRTFYSEDNESRFVIMPFNIHIKQDDYVSICIVRTDRDYADSSLSDVYQHFMTTGYDTQSVENVEYVTLDPIFEKNYTVPSTIPSTDTSYFWFGGQVSNA